MKGPAKLKSERGLRNKPRQERSERRIIEILDAAERVVAQMGYKATTTNHVAAEAQISIATLYRWFPDMNTLTEALAKRYLDRLLALLESLIVDIPELTTPQLLEEVLPALAKFFGENPALAEILSVCGIGDEPGRELREGFVSLAEDIIQNRVHKIPDEEKRLSGQALVTIILGFFTQNMRSPNDADWVKELVYVTTAYVVAKYPAEDDSAWQDPDRVPKPVRPGIANKRAEKYNSASDSEA